MIRFTVASGATLAFDSSWDFGAAGTPVMSTAAGVVDELYYTVVNAAGGAKSVSATYRKGA
jgi:hypothetical protein